MMSLTKELESKGFSKEYISGVTGLPVTRLKRKERYLKRWEYQKILSFYCLILQLEKQIEVTQQKIKKEFSHGQSRHANINESINRGRENKICNAPKFDTAHFV